MALNYVKFQRGTQENYNRLKMSNKGIDKDTLYFIYDKDSPETGGLLYLGDVLIGGSGSINVTAFGDLTDVDLQGLSDGSFLQYNNESGTWEPILLTDALNNIDILPTVKAIQKKENQNDIQALEEISSPKEGDIVFVDDVPYIYNNNDKKWQKISDSNLNDRVTTIEQNIDSIQTELAAVDTKILKANHLKYQVVDGNNLPTITDDNAANLNNTIFLLRNENETGNNLYDEYMVVNDGYERLGTFGVDLNNYVTNNILQQTVETLNNNINNNLQNYVLQTTYNAEVGDLNALINAVGKESTTIVDEILELQDRLQWNDL